MKQIQTLKFDHILDSLFGKFETLFFWACWKPVLNEFHYCIYKNNHTIHIPFHTRYGSHVINAYKLVHWWFKTTDTFKFRDKTFFLKYIYGVRIVLFDSNLMNRISNLSILIPALILSSSVTSMVSVIFRSFSFGVNQGI